MEREEDDGTVFGGERVEEETLHHVAPTPLSPGRVVVEHDEGDLRVSAKRREDVGVGFGVDGDAEEQTQAGQHVVDVQVATRVEREQVLAVGEEGGGVERFAVGEQCGV